MAEYKYRALGWQDDDIASLNVVDATADDNQVELQITKQGEGGTISGPAIIGTNGITIDKSAEGEKIEISGSGLLSVPSTPAIEYNIKAIDKNGNQQSVPLTASIDRRGAVLRGSGGRLLGYCEDTTTYDTPYTLTNKKYVDDNYVKNPSQLVSNTDEYQKDVSAVDSTGKQVRVKIYGSDTSPGTIPLRRKNGEVRVGTPLVDTDAANKKYVDDAVAAGTGTVDGTSIVKDSDGKIQLNQEYIDYLDNQLYQPPAISAFSMYLKTGTAALTTNEKGTELEIGSFYHKETNIKNIKGELSLYVNNATAASTTTAATDTGATATLSDSLTITDNTKFTLKGNNTKDATFSKDYQINFYRYAYTAATTATTAPTSGATQQAAVSTFASNGNTFDYTKGGYIYFYTDNTGKKVQTNVLGQWADVDTTDMGKVTLTQKNGVAHEYTCYRIGPFIETGSAKYRV